MGCHPRNPQRQAPRRSSGGPLRYARASAIMGARAGGRAGLPALPRDALPSHLRSQRRQEDGQSDRQGQRPTSWGLVCGVARICGGRPGRRHASAGRRRGARPPDPCSHGREGRSRRASGLRRRDADGGAMHGRHLPGARARHGRQGRGEGPVVHPLARSIREGVGRHVRRQAPAVRREPGEPGGGRGPRRGDRGGGDARPGTRRRPLRQAGSRLAEGRQAASDEHRRVDPLPPRRERQRRGSRSGRRAAPPRAVDRRAAAHPRPRAHPEHQRRGLHRRTDLLHR